MERCIASPDLRVVVGRASHRNPVEHHARTMGKSKYGLSRTIKVIFDADDDQNSWRRTRQAALCVRLGGLADQLLSLLCAIFAFVMKMPTGRTMRTLYKHRCGAAMVMLVLGIQFFSDGPFGRDAGAAFITNRRPGDLCGAGKNRL